MLPASGRHDRSVHLYVTGALGGDVSWKAALWEWPRLYHGVGELVTNPLVLNLSSVWGCWAGTP